MVVPQPEVQPANPTQATSLARELYLILFPNGFEERIESILDEVGVPGYSEGPNLVGRGSRGRHFDSQVWRGTTGQIFTAIEVAGGGTHAAIRHTR